MKTIRIITAVTLLAAPLRAQLVNDGASRTLINETNTITGAVTVGTNGSFTLLVISNNALLTNSGNGTIGRNVTARSNEVRLTSASIAPGGFRSLPAGLPLALLGEAKRFQFPPRRLGPILILFGPRLRVQRGTQRDEISFLFHPLWTGPVRAPGAVARCALPARRTQGWLAL